jgi:hypothetical protein
MISMPRIEQVQELLSNPSELQDILKKLFGANDNMKVSPPEEYQTQFHLTSPSSYHSQTPVPFNNTPIYSSPSGFNNTTNNNNNPPLRIPSISNGSQPYNSSLAFMQGNRRNLPPLQTPDRCFSSSNNKNNKIQQQQQPSRSF